MHTDDIDRWYERQYGLEPSCLTVEEVSALEAKARKARADFEYHQIWLGRREAVRRALWRGENDAIRTNQNED